MAQSLNIIWVTSTNIYSINRVFIQQTLEIIGQITKSNIDQNPQEMLKIKPVILELYKQIMWYLFEQETNEKRYTGMITSYPKLRQAVNETWGAVWDSFEKLHQEENSKERYE